MQGGGLLASQKMKGTCWSGADKLFVIFIISHAWV